MSLADRRTAALHALHRRPPTTAPRFPGETQPSGDLPDDPWQAEAYRAATRWLDVEPAAGPRRGGVRP